MVGRFIFFNGEIFSKEQPIVSPFDRGFQYGESVYEVVPVYNSKLFFVDEAWQRLQASAEILSIELPEDKTFFLKNAHKLIGLNEVDTGFIYLQISRGVSYNRHAIDTQSENSIFMYCKSHDFIKNMESMQSYRLLTVEEMRWKFRTAKCCNLIPNAMAKHAARSNFSDEALFVENGFVNEGSSSSFFWIKNDILFIRTHDSDVLPGIRANIVTKMAEEVDIPKVFGVFNLQDVKMCDEAFLTSATLGIKPVHSIDGHVINGGIPGPWTKKLVKKYIQIFEDSSLPAANDERR